MSEFYNGFFLGVVVTFAGMFMVSGMVAWSLCNEEDPDEHEKEVIG